jgi:hypothetical protein
MTPHMTHRQARDLQRRWAAKKQLPEEEMRWVLGELGQLTREREKAGALLRQLAKSWPPVRDGLAQIGTMFIDE